jgi:cytochrome c biogenesis protein ResB
MRSAVLVALMVALAGCSSRAVYQTMQGWQQQECRKLPDAAERQRCLGSTAASYDDYHRRAREAAQGPK